jgi:arginase
MNQKKIEFIGYACGLAAANQGCSDGPDYLKNSLALAQLASAQKLSIDWKILGPNRALTNKYKIIADISKCLAAETQRCVTQQQDFCVVSGDHSSAIGTWSGVAQALRPQGDLGLIWIDAHLDSHTHETTLTGNIHGMPVSALLGCGHKELISVGGDTPKIKPENLCLIGIRSFEPEERELLEQLGVRIYYINEVEQRGFVPVFHEALAQVTQHTAGFGVSIDLDGLDPEFAPGTGTPVNNGLVLSEVVTAFTGLCKDSNFLGLEIAEFNPHECPDNRTVGAICALLKATFCGSG